MADLRVLSIGTLAAHPLWDEKADVRTGHATTTLISVGGAHVLVDPSLPGRIVEARLGERSNVRVEDITHVFLTTFSIEHYRGLSHFPDAEWLIHAPEREAADAALEQHLERARDGDDDELAASIGNHIDLLRRCHDASDNVVPGVDLFPLPGFTPGTCGLLLPLPTRTVLICGDAVATVEHLNQGKVLPTCADIEQAQESFREAIDIADEMVLGRDNVVYNPLKRLM